MKEENIMSEEIKNTEDVKVENITEESCPSESEVKKEASSDVKEEITEEITEETPEVIESMEDYKDELEASFRTINVDDVIKGTVIDVNEEEVTLDLKYYTQGIIKAEDFSADPTFSVLNDVRIGDEVEATVIKLDDGQGNILLSKKEANELLSWDLLKAYKTEKKDVSVKVAEAVNGGVVAYLEGIRGFIPASQLDLSYVEDTSPYVNQTLMVRVTEVNASNEKLILSAKEILLEQKAEERSHKVAMIAPGTVLEGTVESLQTYGAFIDLSDGLSGLCHISQICERRIKKPSEVLKVGDKVKVKVLNTNDGKISLSIKACQEILEADSLNDESLEEYSNSESIGTGLAGLLAGLKL